MKSYRDLQIYNESRKLAIEIHSMSMKLPAFELYETGSQIRRSSKAVTTLIVEGFACRRYKADFIKYLIYAIAECDETMVHLDFLFETKSLKSKNLYDDFHNRYVELGKKINKFTQWVEATSLPSGWRMDLFGNAVANWLTGWLANRLAGWLTG